MAQAPTPVGNTEGEGWWKQDLAGMGLLVLREGQESSGTAEAFRQRASPGQV